MYYGNIKNFDIANGVGVRVSLFVSGCTNHCLNCFQPQTWDFTYGKPFTKEVQDQIIDMLRPDYIRGLTVLGGEPFEPLNQKELVPFLLRVREELPGKDIWCYSGFRLEEMQGTELETVMDGNPRESRSAYVRTEDTDDMLSLLDVLVDGRFVESLKNISLEFRGSENQRLIDMPATLKLQNGRPKSGEVVLWSHKM